MMEVGNIVKFKYRNRFVKGEIVSVEKTRVQIKLLTDYIGKNEEWFIGDLKYFFKKSIK